MDVKEHKPKIILGVFILISLLVAGIIFNFTGEIDRGSEPYIKNNIETIDYDKSYDGLNLFANRPPDDVHERKIILSDNFGNIVRTWDVSSIQPNPRRFNYPVILKGGDAIYVNYLGELVRVNQNSEVVWQNNREDVYSHHDVAMYNDQILSFNRVKINPENTVFDFPIIDDEITRINRNSGKQFGKRVSLYDAFRDNENLSIEKRYEENLKQGREMDANGEISGGVYRVNGGVNLFHSNSIYVLREDYGGEFQKGRVLMSLRNLDIVVLLDWDTEEIVWHSKLDFDRQHHPTMTEDGNILVFDNGWERRNSSRVVKFSPDNEILWEYKGNPPESFYSQYMGSAYDLPNGNILITESGSDRAFEITKDKEIVWEFDGDKMGGIFRWSRFEEDCIRKVLDGQKSHSRLCLNY